MSQLGARASPATWRLGCVCFEQPRNEAREGRKEKWTAARNAPRARPLPRSPNASPPSPAFFVLVGADRLELNFVFCRFLPTSTFESALYSTCWPTLFRRKSVQSTATKSKIRTRKTKQPKRAAVEYEGATMYITFQVGPIHLHRHQKQVLDFRWPGTRSSRY